MRMQIKRKPTDDVKMLLFCSTKLRENTVAKFERGE